MISPALDTKSDGNHAPDTVAYATWPADTAPTLDAHYGDKRGLENQHINAGGGLFVAGQMPEQQKPEKRL